MDESATTRPDLLQALNQKPRQFTREEVGETDEFLIIAATGIGITLYLTMEAFNADVAKGQIKYVEVVYIKNKLHNLISD